MWIECEVFEGDWEVIRMKKAGWGQIVEGLKGQELYILGRSIQDGLE